MAVKRHLRSLAARCAECAPVERELQLEQLAELQPGAAVDVERVAKGPVWEKRAHGREQLELLWDAREVLWFRGRLNRGEDWDIIRTGLTVEPGERPNGSEIARHLKLPGDRVRRRLKHLYSEAELLQRCIQKACDTTGRIRRVENAMDRLSAHERAQWEDKLEAYAGDSDDASLRRWQSLAGLFLMEQLSPRKYRLSPEQREWWDYVGTWGRPSRSRCPACGRFVSTPATGRPRKWCQGRRGERCRKRIERGR